MAYRQIPVLGVNLGRLGFLADLQPEEVRACFSQVLQGNFRVTNHLMFECQIHDDQGAGRTLLGLNEIVVHTGPPFHMLDLLLEIDGDGVARFSGDGLIISTPVGSTAHSLSAGGPILGQELSAFVITPLCPHTLTFRPVVDAADKTYTITLGKPAKNAVLIIDGQETLPLRAGQRVTLKRAPVEFRLVKVPGRSYYQTLRDKLRWGAPPNFRGEP
jgi:NAD+ kinase